jgi:hypothetical protein
VLDQMVAMRSCRVLAQKHLWGISAEVTEQNERPQRVESGPSLIVGSTPRSRRERSSAYPA